MAKKWIHKAKPLLFNIVPLKLIRMAKNIDTQLVFAKFISNYI